MFKEEVEDIPSYEPRIDDETPPTGDGDEAIPSSVAALKEMLFGGSQTQKYSKEGPMSLRFGAIVDTENYDEALHEMLSPSQQHATSLSHESQQQLSHYPGQDNTSREGREVSPQQEGVASFPHQEGVSPENEYEAPWDSKPISKYSVVGHRKQTSSPAQKTEPFEVETHTTAVPGTDMEWRNVHSLERQLKTDPFPPQLPPKQWKAQALSNHSQESDLLQSINNTLQKRSKYGSDTLLNMPSFSQGDVPANYYQQTGQGDMSQGKGRSSRGELEKIRTQHKQKSITLPTGYHGNPLQQQQRGLSHSQQSVNQSGIGGGWRGASVGGRRRHRGLSHTKGTRKTWSVDALQVDPSTLVTYNTYTQSHTLQSLV